MKSNRKDYIPIEQFLGIHPNEYAYLLTQQKNILYNKLIELNKAERLSNKELKSITTQLSRMLILAFPHLFPSGQLGE